jgi:hypothetical protein
VRRRRIKCSPAGMHGGLRFFIGLRLLNTYDG